MKWSLIYNLSTSYITELLKKPSKLLTALDNSKSQAQFHFSQESIEVLVKSITFQNPSLVICMGTPSIFEALEAICQNVLLLDIDQRLAMFHKNFCHYNMFNHHFFDEESLEIYKEQLGKHEKVIVVTDPPFGGRPELITNTLELIKNDFGITRNKTHVSMN